MTDYPVSYYSDEPIHAPLKVNLFSRIHEMEQLTHHLTTVAELPLLQRKVWLSENEELLEDSLELFAQQAPVQLDESDMDHEMMKLLMEYTSVLQELMRTVHTVFASSKPTKVRKPSSRSLKKVR